MDVPEVEPAAKPSRGRRKTSADSQVTKDLIVAAAAQEFAQGGYDTTSMRGIARRAGVDPALVHHYFAEKAELFAASLVVPLRPDLILRVVLEGPADAIGESLARAIVTQLRDPVVRSRMISLIHAGLGQEFVATMIRQFVRRELFRRMAKRIGTEDAELRASLVAAQIVGLLIARYGIRMEPLSSADDDDVVARVGPVLQWLLTGEVGTRPG